MWIHSNIIYCIHVLDETEWGRKRVVLRHSRVCGPELARSHMTSPFI